MYSIYLKANIHMYTSHPKIVNTPTKTDRWTISPRNPDPKKPGPNCWWLGLGCLGAYSDWRTQKVLQDRLVMGWVDTYTWLVQRFYLWKVSTEKTFWSCSSFLAGYGQVSIYIYSPPKVDYFHDFMANATPQRMASFHWIIHTLERT